MWKKIFVNLLLSIIFIAAVNSCSNNNYIETNFQKMLQSKENSENDYIIYQSKDLTNSYTNKYYKIIVEYDKKANDFLLNKSKSEIKTKFIITNITLLTEGDIAICLLLDINKISDKNFENKLVPDHLKTGYKNNGASVWWDWIHQNSDNREWIINKFKLVINY